MYSDTMLVHGVFAHVNRPRSLSRGVGERGYHSCLLSLNTGIETRAPYYAETAADPYHMSDQDDYNDLSPEDTCCACYGCPTCDHDCGLPPEVAARRAAVHDAIVANMLGGSLDAALIAICPRCEAYMDIEFADGHKGRCPGRRLARRRNKG